MSEGKQKLLDLIDIMSEQEIIFYTVLIERLMGKA